MNAEGSKSDAADSAALAKKYAENPEDTAVTGDGDTAEYSAKHYAKKAEYWAGQAEAASNVPMASESVAGRTRVTDDIDFTPSDGSTDPVTLSLSGIKAAIPQLMTYEETMAILNEEVTV